MTGTEIVITRVFNAPLERVWKVWTDPEEIKKWWGPKDFTAPVAKIDFRVGGRYLYCMNGQAGPGMPAQDYWSTGTFEEIIPMEKIVATDNFADAEGNIISPESVGMPGEWPDEMRVTALFEEIDGKTKLTIRHEGHPQVMVENATMGWQQSLDKFEAVVAV